jgi:hypothetical protein
MSLEDFAAWLDKNGMFDNSPWTNWFAKKYCENCESIEIDYNEAKAKLDLELFSYDSSAECAYCEYYGFCKFFPQSSGIPSNKETIEMWLTEEAEDEIV